MRLHEWLGELETWLSVQADQLEQSRRSKDDRHCSSPEATALGLVLAVRAVTIAVMDTVRRQGLPEGE